MSVRMYLENNVYLGHYDAEFIETIREETGILLPYDYYPGDNTKVEVKKITVENYCKHKINYYLEYWDDDTFSSTDLPVLSGTSAYPHSMVNAIRTTAVAPPSDWTGASTNASYLSGFSNRLALKNASSVVNEAVYFNIYISIPYDASLFHNQPVETFRYLYS